MGEVRTCGVGGFKGPQPGDPSNTSVLTAIAAFGGIDVHWSYPELNPHAVAHTRLFRSTSANDAAPPQIAVVSGNNYYDKVGGEYAETFYYWIEIVSIHGTVGDRIGPAMGTTIPVSQDLLEYLTGKIDEGVLARSLKTQLDEIQLNKLGIDQELLARAKSDDALAASLSEIEAFSEDTRALVQEEALARVTADEAFVSTVNTLYATVGDNTAAIQEEKEARVDDSSALARSVSRVQSQLGDAISSVETRMETKIESVNGTLTAVGALYTAKVDVNGLVGGFGVYNDGRQVEAGFDVDRFWVGRTRDDKVKPFIISGGRTYIADALIRNASIDKAKIGNAAVDTLKIAGHAVTVAEFKTQYSTLTVPNGSERTLMRKSIQHPGYAAGGAGVIILVHFDANGLGDSDVGVRVRRSGRTLSSGTSSVEGNWGSSYVRAFLDPNPPSNPTYDVNIYVSDHGGNDAVRVYGGNAVFFSGKR